MTYLKTVSLASVLILSLSGCAVAKATGKVAALPVKGVYHTGKYVGKGVVGGTKMVGKGAWGGTKMAGKGVYYTGKGVYKTGETAVHITNGALDTTSRILTVTTQVVDLSGKVVTLSKEIPAAELDATISAAKASARVLSILIDRKA